MYIYIWQNEFNIIRYFIKFISKLLLTYQNLTNINDKIIKIPEKQSNNSKITRDVSKRWSRAYFS